jgi:hypothetical protein
VGLGLRRALFVIVVDVQFSFICGFGWVLDLKYALSPWGTLIFKRVQYFAFCFALESYL